MNVTGWAANHKITMACEPENANPHMMSDEKWSREASHWKCVLSHGLKRMTVHFSQGSGHKGAEPKISSVLSSLALDAQSYENARGFEDWASDLGLDNDSRKAEKMYRLVGQETKKLKNFLGPTLTQKLLYEVELD